MVRFANVNSWKSVSVMVWFIFCLAVPPSFWFLKVEKLISEDLHADSQAFPSWHLTGSSDQQKPPKSPKNRPCVSSHFSHSWWCHDVLVKWKTHTQGIFWMICLCVCVCVPFLRSFTVFWENCAFASMPYFFRLTNVCVFGALELRVFVSKRTRLMSIAWSWYSIHEVKWRSEE